MTSTFLIFVPIVGALLVWVLPWRSQVQAGGFALLVALLRLEYAIMGAVIASFVVLYVVRLPFGVGAWKIEATEEDVRTRALIGERTKNPSGVRCPKCGAERMWIADDGSAFCLACRTGTIELAGREPS